MCACVHARVLDRMLPLTCNKRILVETQLLIEPLAEVQVNTCAVLFKLAHIDTHTQRNTHTHTHKAQAPEAQLVVFSECRASASKVTHRTLHITRRMCTHNLLVLSVEFHCSERKGGGGGVRECVRRRGE